MNPKIYLNKANFVEQIEMPDGDVTKRLFGLLPNLEILRGYEDKEIDIYDHKGKLIKRCLLLEVKKLSYTYETLEVFEEG